MLIDMGYNKLNLFYIGTRLNSIIKIQQLIIK